MGEFGRFIKIVPYYTVALVGGGAFVIFSQKQETKIFSKKKIQKSPIFLVKKNRHTHIRTRKNAFFSKPILWLLFNLKKQKNTG